MNIYLACTVRGDRGAVAGLRSLVASLEAAGHTILTKHLLDDNVEGAESALTERAVYERDIEWLEACDVLIADASGSSFGVGFEVGYVLGRSDRTDQRVVLLYRADRRDRISRLDRRQRASAVQGPVDTRTAPSCCGWSGRLWLADGGP